MKKMNVTRRDFAKSLGAGIVLLPFLQSPAKAGAASNSNSNGNGPKRLLFISSLGINYNWWVPQSSAGAPVSLGLASKSLSPILDDIMFVGGLSGPQPGESHNTSQHTTALGFGDNNKVSIDQYLAQQLNPATKLPSIVLGASSKSAAQFFQSGQQLISVDSPVDAFNLAFAAPPSSSGSAAPPRQKILDLVSSQIKSLKGSLGSQENAKLDAHLAGISQLEQQLSGGGLSSTCVKPAMPVLTGIDPGNTASTAAVGQMQMKLIPAMLSCGVTNIVALQWGISNLQVIYGNNATGDEHSNNHSPGVGDVPVQEAENYLATCFVSLIQSLKSTADPQTPGKSLLDTTFVYWTRDIGNGPDHTQNAVPIVMAGATGYLKYQPAGSGGTYYDLGGQGTTKRALLNVIEAMGAPIGNFGVSQGSSQTDTPLSQIKV